MIYIPENANKLSFTHICSDYPALLWRQTYSYKMNQHTLLFVEYNIRELSHIFSVDDNSLIRCPYCSSLPQLRFNKLNNSYSCVCLSERIPNDDGTELKLITSWSPSILLAFSKWLIEVESAILSKNYSELYDD